MRALTLIVVLLLAGCARGPSQKVVVLGLDGADPVLCRRYMKEGKMPNLQRLAESGSFTELGTSNPPQSPVAWSNFVTGAGPATHGIFDFVHRDPQTLTPVPSMSRVKDGKLELLRRGRPFWQQLEQHGIPSRLLKVPVSFPPAGTAGTLLTGMGTPDLEGTYGTFSFYSDRPEGPPEDLTGGRFVPVEVREGRVRASLMGPLDARLPLEVWVDGSAALIALGEQRQLLKAGEWSPWIPLDFGVAQGMVRCYLQSLEPHFALYVSPVNIDPCRPGPEVSSPASFSRHLCRCCGPFYTQGMAEETKALTHGLFNDEEFLKQSRLVLEERNRLLDQSLADFEGGLLFFYVSTIDIVSHLYWRAQDPQHPGASLQAPGYEKTIEEAYLAADAMLGRVLAAVGPEATVLVVSDHGFAPFYRAFDPNRWLQQRGYLKLFEGRVDWSRTRAYAMGFNGVYLNIEGREAQGIVDPSEAEALKEELRQELLGVRDGEKAVFRRVQFGSLIYDGPHAAEGPDLVLGYERGFRCSWQSVLGQAAPEILADNLDHWSGDHLIDPEVVPGILVCNRRVALDDPALVDLAPSLAALFSIEPDPQWRGRNLWGKP